MSQETLIQIINYNRFQRQMESLVHTQGNHLTKIFYLQTLADKEKEVTNHNFLRETNSKTEINYNNKIVTLQY